jgi:hypothetical protein
MHVVELLANFLLTPDVEVIEPGLPETQRTPVIFCKCETQLSGRRPALASPQITLDALLQYLQHDGRQALGGFADEFSMGYVHIALKPDGMMFVTAQLVAAQ